MTLRAGRSRRILIGEPLNLGTNAALSRWPISRLWAGRSYIERDDVGCCVWLGCKCVKTQTKKTKQSPLPIKQTKNSIRSVFITIVRLWFLSMQGLSFISSIKFFDPTCKPINTQLILLRSWLVRIINTRENSFGYTTRPCWLCWCF